MSRTVFASVVEISTATTVSIKVRGGIEGTGRVKYSLKCWDNALAIENAYERVKIWLYLNGYEPVYSKGCYRMILYWKRVIE